jgi:hypothetical protein
MSKLLDNYLKSNKTEIENMLLLMYISDYNYLRDENVAYQLTKHIHENIFNENFDVFSESSLISLIFTMQSNLIKNGTLEFYSGSNCSDACDYARISTQNERLTKLTLEATKSILDETDPLIALNPYFINNGYCFEIAEEVCENGDIQICTILMMEDQEDFKDKVLKTLSDNTNSELIFDIICGANHEWTYDFDSKLHFDSEIPFGVKHLDDIPIFARAIARAILNNNADIGGKWSKNYAQLVIDLTIPFVIENCTFKDNASSLEVDAIKHARLILSKCSKNVSSDFESLILEEKNKEDIKDIPEPKFVVGCLDFDKNTPF